HDLTQIKRTEAELRRRTGQLESANRELAVSNARLKRDLQAAARVQKALLPVALPDAGPVRFAWAFRPCEELAGDLLNIYRLDDAHVGFYVLDVSGHGVAAALLSVTVSRLLSSHGPTSLLRLPPGAERAGELAPPREVVERLN